MTKNYKDMGHRSVIAHKAELEDIVRCGMSDKARRQARHRPYCCDMGPDTGAARLIRAQGNQMEIYGVEDALKKWGVDMGRKIGKE